MTHPDPEVAVLIDKTKRAHVTAQEKLAKAQQKVREFQRLRRPVTKALVQLANARRNEQLARIAWLRIVNRGNTGRTNE